MLFDKKTYVQRRTVLREKVESGLIILLGNNNAPCNIMASINPDQTDRVLITAHYDSRLWADNDADAAHHHTLQ